MKQYMVYKCDYCDFESKSFAETEKHEAEHFGLTVEEFHHWNTLKANARSCGATISRTKNEEIEKIFDDAIEKLMRDGFPTPMMSHFTDSLLRNLVEDLMERHFDMASFASTMSKIIPEITEDEVWKFYEELERD